MAGVGRSGAACRLPSRILEPVGKGQGDAGFPALLIQQGQGFSAPSVDTWMRAPYSPTTHRWAAGQQGSRAANAGSYKQAQRICRQAGGASSAQEARGQPKRGIWQASTPEQAHQSAAPVPAHLPGWRQWSPRTPLPRLGTAAAHPSSAGRQAGRQTGWGHGFGLV